MDTQSGVAYTHTPSGLVFNREYTSQDTFGKRSALIPREPSLVKAIASAEHAPSVRRPARSSGAEIRRCSFLRRELWGKLRQNAASAGNGY